MPEDAVPKAHAAIQQAIALREHASPVEAALIYALAKRYAPEAVADRTPLNEAYAAAMRKVVQQYPDDLDAATLLAEALMDLHPWDYWTREGQPQPWTGEFVELLEGVLRRDPNHPGANHYYIHAVEASLEPQRASAAADRLGTLVPGAGHLVHMPSHIYIRTGRYAEARTANERAIEADDQYVAQCHAQGVYPLAYMSHNHHFLSAAAAMEGRSAQAIESAREMARSQDHDMMRSDGMGALQHYAIWPVYMLARFGKWDEVLREPAPAKDLLYPRGVWHFARGMAQVRRHDLAQAEAELRVLEGLADDPALEALKIWDANSTAAVLRIASKVLAGELAAARGQRDEAIGLFEQAVRLEDALRYDEPATWYAPVRETLGAALLEAGRADEAEAVYREDLRRYPENGFGLFGLAASLRAQGKLAEADEAQERFKTAWQRADVELTSSRF
jgi:tetratricopeptide (TPR) repeat protein